MASHLWHTVGDFFLKVGPVTGPRLAVPATKCCCASRGAAVCRFPLRQSSSRKMEASELAKGDEKKIYASC